MALARHEKDEAPAWEAAMFGADTVDRLQRLGDDSMEWRKRAGYERNEAQQEASMGAFNRRVHTWGKHVMQMQLIDDEKGADKTQHVERVKHEANEAKHRLRRRNVLVADNEAAKDNLGVKIDKEWNTSGWTEEMIHDGVKTLFEIFYDARKATQESKTVACTMLVKLIGRHPEAEDYVKQNIGQLAALAANRFVRGGKSAGILDLLYIVDACKEKFIPELSDCMVVQRMVTLMGIEMHLAAMLIQHVFRRWHHRIKRARRLERGTVLPITLTFGDEDEVLAHQMKAIADRTAELKARWDTMHVWQPAHQRTTCIGLRSPVYLGIPYTNTCMNSIRYLVSDEGVPRGLANANRGDMVAMNGCALMCQFLGCTIGPFASDAAAILAQTAKVPESFVHMIGSGCVRACVNYIQMLLDQNRIDFIFKPLPDRSLDQLAKADREMHPRFISKIAFYDCLNCLAHTAVHAAGIYRAKGGYNYKKQCAIIQESVDYCMFYNLSPKQLQDKPILECLGDAKLLDLIFLLMRTTHQLNSVQSCLRIISGIACSNAYRKVLEETCLKGGVNITRLLELLEEKDSTVHCLIMTLFLQLNTQDPGRHKLIFANIPKYISPSIQPPKGNKGRDAYNGGYYNRSMLVAVSCLRQQEWRAYEPTAYPAHLVGPANVRQAIYLDCLKTLTNMSMAQGSEKMHIADLCVLPIDWEAAHDFSSVAESVCAKELVAWLTHPHDVDYFSILPWEEASGGCIIVDALTCNQGTLETIFSVPMCTYLGKCIHLSRHMFGPKKKLTEGQALVILSGVSSACRSLARICSFVKDVHERNEIIRGVRQSDLLHAAHFYIKTLGSCDVRADSAMVTLQVNTGLAVIQFYTEYTRMIRDMGKCGQVVPEKARDFLGEVLFAGQATVGLIATTAKTFGDSIRTTKVLTTLCDFGVALLRHDNILVDKAIAEWGIFTSLRQNLPQPLSGVGDDGIKEPRYRQGLGRLPASFFDLVSALCVGYPGKILALNEGFLRRALENVVLLMPHRGTGLEAHNTGKPGNPIVLTHCISQRSINTHPVEMNKQDIMNNVEDAVYFSRKLAACLSLIAELGTFSASAAGCANDLILHHQYAIVKNCQLILDDGMYGKGHACTTAAMCCIGALASDCHQVCGEGEVFEKYDILGTLRYYLHYAAELEEPAILAAVNGIMQLTPVPTEYVTKRLKEIVLPLTRVNRLRPSYNQKILNATWAIALRLNSFDTGEGKDDAVERHKRRVMLAVNESAGFSDPNVFTGDMKKALDEDTILKKQLEAIYHEAGIDPTAKPEEHKKPKLNVRQLTKMFGGAPKPSTMEVKEAEGLSAVGNEKEWHNPTFEQAKIMSSPHEVQHRNFVTDSLAKVGIASASLPTSSPHSLEAFRKSPYGKQLANEHARTKEGEGMHINYCLPSASPTNANAAQAWTAGASGATSTSFSAQSTPTKDCASVGFSQKLPQVGTPSSIQSTAANSPAGSVGPSPSSASYSHQGSPSIIGKGSALGSPFSPSSIKTKQLSPMSMSMSPMMQKKTLGWDDGFTSSSDPSSTATSAATAGNKAQTPGQWLDSLQSLSQHPTMPSSPSPKSSPKRAPLDVSGMRGSPKSYSTSPSPQKEWAHGEVGSVVKGKGKKGYLGLEVEAEFLEKELLQQLETSSLSPSTPTPKKAAASSTGTSGSTSGSSKKKSKKGSKRAGALSPAKSPMVVDISDCPEFLESKPPVFKIKDDDAFIC